MKKDKILMYYIDKNTNTIYGPNSKFKRLEV